MISYRAWPRVDGLVEVKYPGGSWRGPDKEADAFLAGLRAGLDASLRAGNDALAWEGRDDRPIMVTPPPRPEGGDQ